MPIGIRSMDGCLPYPKNADQANAHAMTRLQIRPACAADASALSELAARTFLDTFAAVNAAEDMATHVTRYHGVTQQAAEIASPDIRCLLVERGSDLIGYAQLRRGHTPDCVQTANPIELWRFYIDRAGIGHGIAQQLMTAVFAETLKMQATALWLGVWEHNRRAIAFYRKCGFREIGAHEFQLGSDAQKDLIMICNAIG